MAATAKDYINSWQRWRLVHQLIAAKDDEGMATITNHGSAGQCVLRGSLCPRHSS